MEKSELDIIRFYILQHPQAAARDIEALSLNQALIQIRTIPESLAGRVLFHMIANRAAQLCQALAIEEAAKILSNGSPNQIIAILRAMNEPQRAELLTALPEKFVILCRILLNYSDDLVGAWMQLDSLILSDHLSVGDAIKQLSLRQQEYALETIPVVDAEQGLKGLVRPSKLLAEKAHTPIIQILEMHPPTVSSRISLVNAEKISQWREYNSLTVLNRSQQVVGVLSHQALRCGLAQLSHSRPETAQPPENILGDLGQIYLDCVVAMSDLVMAPPVIDLPHSSTSVNIAAADNKSAENIQTGLH